MVRVLFVHSSTGELVQLIDIAREYGAAGLILLGVAVIVVRYLIPLVQSALDQVRQDRELERAARQAAQGEYISTLKAIAEQSQRQIERNQEAFLKSLNELAVQIANSNEQSAKQADHIARISIVINRIAARILEDKK